MLPFFSPLFSQAITRTRQISSHSSLQTCIVRLVSSILHTCSRFTLRFRESSARHPESISLFAPVLSAQCWLSSALGGPCLLPFLTLHSDSRQSPDTSHPDPAILSCLCPHSLDTGIFPILLSSSGLLLVGALDRFSVLVRTIVPSRCCFPIRSS